MKKIFTWITPVLFLIASLGSTFLQMYLYYLSQWRARILGVLEPPAHVKAWDMFFWWYSGANVRDLGQFGFLMYIAIFVYIIGSICWIIKPTTLNFLFLAIIAATFFSYTGVQSIEECIRPFK